MTKRRIRACVEAWPDCETGAYHPSCCRFPNSCSCTVYDPQYVTDDDLEPGVTGSTDTDQADPTDGVWVAFNYDGSWFVPFATELDALRWAAGYHMPVTFVRYGDEDWRRKA